MGYSSRQRRAKHKVTIIYKISNKTAPSYLNDMSSTVNSITSYNVRQNEMFKDIPKQKNYLSLKQVDVKDIPKQENYLSLKEFDVKAAQHLDQNEECLQEDKNVRPSLNYQTANGDLLSKERQKSSLWKTVVNMLNCMEGLGLLALPYAIHGGGLTAVTGLVFVALMTGYTASLLIDCLYEINEDGKKIRVRSNHQEIGFYCWAPLDNVVCVIVSFSAFIGAMSNIVLFSSLMHQMYPGVPLTQSHWSCIAIGIVFPTVFLEYLSKIAWLSLVAVLALVASVCLSLAYEFQEVHNWDVQSLLFWETQGVLIGLNIVIFSYSFHTAVITIEGDMADRSKFKVALISAFSASAVIKVLFAVAGFLTYTTATNEVILNNLPVGLVTKIIATLFGVNVLITYPIPAFVVVEILEKSSLYNKMTEKLQPRLCFAMVRIGVVLLSLGCAVGMPHFALVTSLAGCSSYCLSLLFPGLFHLIIKRKDLTPLQVCIDCVLMVVGVVGLSFGLVETVKALVTI